MRKASCLFIHISQPIMDHRNLTFVDDEQTLDLHLARLQTRLQTITPDTPVSLKVWLKLAQLKTVIDETLSRANDEQHTIHY